MHPLVGRLSLRPDRPPEQIRLAGWRAAAIAVAWMVATSLVPLVLLVLVGWLASGLLGGLADPMRLAVDIWLTAHGVPLELAGGALTLRPLGLTVLILALLWRGGRWVGRSAEPTTFAAAGRLTALVAGGYGAAAALLAVAGTGPVARPNVLLAASAGVAMAAVVGGLGVLSGAGKLAAARDRVPLIWRVAVDAGAGAALVLVGLAALLLVGALVVERGTVNDLAVAVGPDAAGWPLLLMINVLLVPNAVLAAVAYATGPGFAVGIGTSVALGGSNVGALPPLSLLAAVPGSGDPSHATYAVLAIPLLAGIAAGLLAVRRSGMLRPELCALAGLAAGPVAGVLTMAAAWAASGGVGAGQLAMIGPTGWLVGAAVTVEVGVVAAATAWAGCPRSRSTSSADASLVSLSPVETEQPRASVEVPKSSNSTQWQPEPATGPAADDDEETIVLKRHTG